MFRGGVPRLGVFGEAVHREGQVFTCAACLKADGSGTHRGLCRRADGHWEALTDGRWEVLTDGFVLLRFGEFEVGVEAEGEAHFGAGLFLLELLLAVF